MLSPPPMITQEESDSLGQDHDMLDVFPSEGVFKKAIAERDRPRLIWWYRFLTEPSTPRECEMVAEIIGALEDSVPSDHPFASVPAEVISRDPEPETPAEILGALLNPDLT